MKEIRIVKISDGFEEKHYNHFCNDLLSHKKINTFCKVYHTIKCNYNKIIRLVIIINRRIRKT